MKIIFDCAEDQNGHKSHQKKEKRKRKKTHKLLGQRRENECNTDFNDDTSVIKDTK